MKYSRVRAAMAAAIVATFPNVAQAQFPPPPPPPRSPPPTVQERWPEPSKPPRADNTQAPASQPARSRPAPADGAVSPAAPKPVARGTAAEVACGGTFAKDSSHLKLAIKYDSRNIVYGQVDGPEGSRINASILYPNDPKRRLEVIWSNEAARSETSLIAINGKSQWAAPKGLKLGLAVAALEKANGRPFKLTGFGSDGAASVLGWEGGALAALAGGCKVGVRLFADPKAPDDARRAAAGDKELLSSDASIRAVKPTIGEILIGY